MSVNSKMTAIADNIRTLVGATGTLTLDAMATNVGTANGAVTTQAGLIEQILTAIEGKAGLSGGAKFASGSITFASNTSNATIAHNLGEIPNFYYIWSDDVDVNVQTVSLKGGIMYCPDINDNTTYIGGVVGKTTASATTFANLSIRTPYKVTMNIGGNMFSNSKDNSLTINASASYGSSVLVCYFSPATYNWIVGVI